VFSTSLLLLLKITYPLLWLLSLLWLPTLLMLLSLTDENDLAVPNNIISPDMHC